MRGSVHFLRHALIASGAAALLVVLAGCNETAPAPPPPMTGTGSTSKKGNLKSDGDDDSGSKEEDTGTSEASSSSSGSASADEPSSYERPGAQTVGDEATKKDVKDCNDKGKFYDRFGDPSACGGVDLAKVDCTEAGIKKALEGKDKLLKQFKEALGSGYNNMEIDQCVDCPPGTSIEICKAASPPKNGGTKVMFVKMDGTTIGGKGMILPIRPFQK